MFNSITHTQFLCRFKVCTLQVKMLASLFGKPMQLFKSEKETAKLHWGQHTLHDGFISLRLH